jgi:hypothetical protein
MARVSPHIKVITAYKGKDEGEEFVTCSSPSLGGLSATGLPYRPCQYTTSVKLFRPKKKRLSDANMMLLFSHPT